MVVIKDAGTPSDQGARHASVQLKAKRLDRTVRLFNVNMHIGQRVFRDKPKSIAVAGRGNRDIPVSQNLFTSLNGRCDRRAP
jgi:hypothetical protein